MKIDLEKGKPISLEATYDTWLNFDVSDLDIDWTQVENIYCKYCTLTIHMKNGDEHEITNYSETETDYKWPVKLKLLDADFNELWEE